MTTNSPPTTTCAIFLGHRQRTEPHPRRGAPARLPVGLEHPVEKAGGQPGPATVRTREQAARADRGRPHRADRAGLRPQLLAEVDDMAMLRLRARDADALALVPPVVVQDELRAGILVEVHRVAEISERFYAITPSRRFPNPVVRELVAGAAEVSRPEAANSGSEPASNP